MAAAYTRGMKTFWLGLGFIVVAGVAVAQKAAETPAKPTTPKPDPTMNYQPLIDALRRGSSVEVQGQFSHLGLNPREIPTFSNLYNLGCRSDSNGEPESVMCAPFIWAQTATYSYWEPAAIVEVSCQKGFSYLSPNLLGPTSTDSLELSNECGEGPNWFFNVRVWTSSPKPSGDRAIIHGSGFWAVSGGGLCSARGTTGNDKYPFGYGAKYDQIRGIMESAPDGPAGSFTAYISDRDPTWRGDKNTKTATLRSPPPNQVCKQGVPDVAACWGDERQATGWVTHPNRAVAAALVSLRGLRKAQSMNRTATERNGGLRMSMDYPFVKAPSDYAESMGTIGKQKSQHRGSDCFVPGESSPGPWWATTGRRGQPDIALQNPNPTLASNADAGTYIFSYWVKTGCRVYNRQIGSCKDEFFY